MGENVDNRVLEQLRLIREDIRTLRSDLAEVRTGVRGDLASVIGQRDGRGGHVEDKLGIRP